MTFDTAAKLNRSIRDLMGRERATQAELADVLGISQPGVSARLAGRIDWTVNEVELVAAHFGVPLARLLQSSELVLRGGPAA